MRILGTGFAVAVLCGLAGPAAGQNASVSSEDAGATTGLGSSHRFASADAAAGHCPGDVVVWAPGNGLAYFMPGSPGYAVGAKGFYACKMEADGAGFSAKN